MKDSIFREYDIRGRPGVDFSIDDAVVIGKGFGSIIGKGKIVVGRDVRLTSEKLMKKLIKGLISIGCDVIDIGIVPTPILNFSIKKLKADAGICVTASHNPPEYNGFKFRMKNAIPFAGKDLQKLKRKLQIGGFKSGKGKIKEKDMVLDYLKIIKKRVKIKKKLKIVIDCGNGTCSKIAPGLFEDLGCKVVDLYCFPNGRFPNHVPDPSNDKNLSELKKKVLNTKADVGIAFDNDGDRVGFVDEKGNIVRSDIAMIFLVKNLLEDKKKSKIIHDVKFSRSFIEFVRKHGDVPVMERVGYPNITKRMIKEKAEIAGEFSGHFYYLKNGPYSDALFTAIRFLEQLSRENKPLSELIKPHLKYYSTNELRVRVAEGKVEHIIKKIKKKFRSKFRIIEIDGLRIEAPYGWGLVRASHTEPVLSMRFEAESRERLKKLKNLILSEIGLLD